MVLLCGCTPLAAAPTPEQPEVQNLDWYINYSWFTAGWGNNHVTQKITEETGITVSFSTPLGDESLTLDTLMAQGDLPDLITLGWWLPQVGQLIDKEMVYPLNQLADEGCPEFYQVSDPDTVAWYTQEDGNIYCYPSSSVPAQAYEEGTVPPSNLVFVVREDLYQELGSPDMSTPEGFSDALRQAKEQFPEVDGYPLYPFGCAEFNDYGGSSLNEHMRNFLNIPYEKDGQAWDYISDPEYQLWLETFRALLSEGTISMNFLLDHRQQVSENLMRGQYFCLLYQWSDIEGEMAAIEEQWPERRYIAVDGPKNSLGEDHALPGVGLNGWTVTFISKDCEDPQKALELMTYLMSEEGQKLVQLGVEGVDYTWQDGTAVLTPETYELMEQDYERYVQEVGGNNTYWMLQNDVMQNSWQVDQPSAVEQMMDWALPYTVDITPYEVVFPPGSELAMLEEKQKRLWGETLPQLLLAKSTNAMKRKFNQYLIYREELGWSQLQEARSQVYQANMAKLAALHEGEGTER